jgi:hypothetical protein
MLPRLPKKKVNTVTSRKDMAFDIYDQTFHDGTTGIPERLVSTLMKASLLVKRTDMITNN